MTVEELMQACARLANVDEWIVCFSYLTSNFSLPDGRHFDYQAWVETNNGGEPEMEIGPFYANTIEEVFTELHAALRKHCEAVVNRYTKVLEG